MSSTGPPRRSDPRREAECDEEEIPTDVILPGAPPRSAITKLRFELPRLHDDSGGLDEQTEMNRPSPSSGIAGAALPSNVRAWLEFQRGGATQSPLELTMVRTVLGRGRQADIRIQDRKLSRKHTIIFFTGEEFRIRDEGSANGTSLNGSRVVEYALRDRDRIAIGASVLVFRTERAG